MYKKDLSEDLRLRMSKTDMDFLRKLSAEREQSVSQVIRNIIGEYRRGLETLSILSRALDLTSERGVTLSDGDTKTDIDDKL